MSEQGLCSCLMGGLPPLPQGMFFPLRGENVTLPNEATEPLVQETERMVYMAVSEYFFDSALFAYFRAGVLSMEIAGAQVGQGLASTFGRGWELAHSRSLPCHPTPTRF